MIVNCNLSEAICRVCWVLGVFPAAACDQCSPRCRQLLLQLLLLVFLCWYCCFIITGQFPDMFSVKTGSQNAHLW